MIQKYYRRRYYYRKYHPIIMIRLKIGKKTYYMYCFNSWKEYNNICRRIKNKIRYHYMDCLLKNFNAMKTYIQSETNGRKDKAKMLLVRSFNASIYSKFLRWVQYVTSIKKLKVRLRRLFGFPHFDMWCEYIKWVKIEKNKLKAIIKIQSLFRCYIIRKKFLIKKNAQKKLKHFSLLVLSKVKVRNIRKYKIYQEFLEWEPEETQRKSIRANDLEKQRLIKRQQYILEQEKKALIKIKQHLKSPDGKLQLEEMMKNSYNWNHLNKIMKKFGLYKDMMNLSKADKLNYCTKAITTECSYVTRLLEAHNFDTKSIPFLICPDINCHAIFTTEHQYHHHMKISTIHNNSNNISNSDSINNNNNSNNTINNSTTCPQFSHFHMLLRHYKGIECLRLFLTKSNGISGLLNVLDAWVSIQEWKKLPTTNENYEIKAMNILELYLLEDSPRKIIPDMSMNLTTNSYQAMIQQLNVVKYKEYQGFYKLLISSQTKMDNFLGWTGNILGWTGKEFYHYSTEETLLPDIFVHFEWNCFMQLFNALNDSMEFQGSMEYKTYQDMIDMDTKRRHDENHQMYENYRKLKIKQWTSKFIEIEKMISEKALEAVNMMMDREIIKIYHKIEKTVVYHQSIEMRHMEQIKYEYNSLIIDDTVYFCETDILNSIFDLYTVSLLDTMLKIPELRKGMLQYAGYLKTTSRHLQIKDTKLEKKNEEWFDNFYQNTKSMEQKKIQDDLSNNNFNQLQIKNNLIIKIQKRIRGYLGRKKARKIFIKLYVKKIDPTSGLYYYSNIKTGKATWERPAITKYLLPHVKW